VKRVGGIHSDPFRPRREPALSLYLAFQGEASKRCGRTVAEWSAAEVTAVYEAAIRLAPLHGLREPTRQDVESAEAYARGSIDYGLTWVTTLINALAQKA